jgi:hypothetical protein
MGPTLFDHYIAVDWSANNKPKRGEDSIWVGTTVGGDHRMETLNPSTRRQAEAWLRFHSRCSICMLAKVQLMYSSPLVRESLPRRRLPSSDIRP